MKRIHFCLVFKDLVRLSFCVKLLSSSLCYFLSHKILRIDEQAVIGKIDELGR